MTQGVPGTSPQAAAAHTSQCSMLDLDACIIERSSADEWLLILLLII